MNLLPHVVITPDDINRGKKLTIRDGTATQIMLTATEGVFLISFALLLGANNVVIGIIAAIPFFGQITQILGIYLVEKYRKRKKLTIIILFFSRAFLLFIALIPLIEVQNTKLNLLIIFLFFRNVSGAVAGVSWNSWIRDLVPPIELGNFFSKRMQMASIAGIIGLILFSAFLDSWKIFEIGNEELGYSILFAIGFISGMISLRFLYKTPEPQMVGQLDIPLSEMLISPFKDKSFQPLIVFLFLWNLAVNLATPFFTVYMISQLSLPLSQITLLLIISQTVNIWFLKIWGNFADRFSYKSTLGICAPLFALTLPLWSLTVNPTTNYLGFVILLIIHIIMGITMAGINLSIATIALKIAPSNKSSTYIASAGITNSLGAGIGTLIGGVIAQYFKDKTLNFSVEWISAEITTPVTTYTIEYWDFVFLISFFLSLIAIERLSAVQEFGSIARREAVYEFLHSVRIEARKFSSLAGLSRISQINPRRFFQSNNHKSDPLNDLLE